jgi:hypothetical protein
MNFPRRLYRTDAEVVEYCEEGDPQAAYLVGPRGYEMPDIEADRLGIQAYFEEHPGEIEEKEQGKAEFEDKAESPPTGIHIEPEIRGRRR